MYDRKHKAVELRDKFSNEVGHMSVELNGAIGKEIAKLCIDEILNESDFLDEYHGHYYTSRQKYWKEVKQELEKL